LSFSTIVYWRRYEAENYFTTPDILSHFVMERYRDQESCNNFQTETEEVLSQVIIERLFAGNTMEYETWKNADVTR